MGIFTGRDRPDRTGEAWMRGMSDRQRIAANDRLLRDLAAMHKRGRAELKRLKRGSKK